MPRAFPWVCTLAFALAAVSCTSSSSAVSVAAPTFAKCQTTAASSRASFGASGGAGALTISTERDCQWSMQTAVTWIALDGPGSGQGPATVNFAVSANGAPAVRKGSIVVAGSSIEIAQDAALCRYALDRSSASMGADGGPLLVSVAALAGCTWNVSTDASWMAIATAPAGNGSGSAQIAIAPNPATAVRTGHVMIADQIVVVSQQGRAATAPPSTPSPPKPPSPSPPSPPPPPAPSPAPPSTPQPPSAPAPPPDAGRGGKNDDGGDKGKGKDPKHDDGGKDDDGKGKKGKDKKG